MATRYYGLELGQGQKDVADGLSTNTVTFEFAVNLDDGATRDQVEDALEMIKAAINERPWPPAAA